MAQPTVVNTRVATPELWDDLVEVFGTRGDASRCWCQWFIAYRSTSENRAALRDQLDNPDPQGVLAYQDDVPVGWLRIGPLRDLPRLAASRALAPLVRAEPQGSTGLWQASCFVVRVGYRRQGVTEALLTAGVQLARDLGARGIVAHPLDLATFEKKPSSAELYVGSLTTFLKAGFEEVTRPSPHRPWVRLELTGSA